MASRLRVIARNIVFTSAATTVIPFTLINIVLIIAARILSATLISTSLIRTSLILSAALGIAIVRCIDLLDSLSPVSATGLIYLVS